MSSSPHFAPAGRLAPIPAPGIDEHRLPYLLTDCRGGLAGIWRVPNLLQGPKPGGSASVNSAWNARRWQLCVGCSNAEQSGLPQPLTAAACARSLPLRQRSRQRLYPAPAAVPVRVGTAASGHADLCRASALQFAPTGNLASRKLGAAFGWVAQLTGPQSSREPSVVCLLMRKCSSSGTANC